MTLEFTWGGRSSEYRVKKGGFFEYLKNIHNETFLIQTLLVLSQLEVGKLIPNIIFAFKSGFETVDATKLQKIMKKVRFFIIFHCFSIAKH